MPLEDPQVVDLVRKTEDGKIILVITDAGSVADPRERVGCLVQKLKVYINSIVSGDLKRDYPDHSARDYIIEVACSREPTPEMLSISEVMPRKDPANKVPVRFVEFPEGAWGPAKPKATNTQDERLDALSTAALERGVTLAESYLEEEEKGFYFAVLGWEESKIDVVCFREDSVTAEVKREVDAYVSDLAPAFTVCVVVSVEQVIEFKRSNREALVLVLHRRGRQEAEVYARPVRKKSVLNKYQVADTLQLIGVQPGLLRG